MVSADEDRGRTASKGSSSVMKEEKLFFRNRARIPKRRPKESEKKETIHIVRPELNSKTREKKFRNTESPVISASMERAKKTQSSLPPESPSFIKLMLPSHVSGGFWLGLPKKFCNLHLLKQDSAICLEDKDGKAYKTKFLFAKVGLSAGWRGFSVAHGLREGDVLVFQLVNPCHWKVFIWRVDNLNEVDGALSRPQLYPSCNEPKKRKLVSQTIRVLLSSMPSYISAEHSDYGSIVYRKGKHGQIDGKSSPVEETDGVLAPKVLNGIRLCKFSIRFEDVKQPEDFVIIVDGLVIGDELSSHLRNKYYELCLSQSHFLHNNLIKGLNCKLVVGIISETVNIADAIRASRVTTSAEDFVVWEKTLKAFQELGMGVGLLLARLRRVKNLAAAWKSMRDENADDEGLAENIASFEVICQSIARRSW